MSTDLLAALDPAGMPGPPWLFHVLLVFTFFLHLVFLNLTLGGTLLAAVAHLAAGGRAGDHRTVLARRLMAINTYGISLTITTGVAPLLLIQVLYQQYFYTATILIGGVWLGFLGLLIVGYYAAYLYKFRGVPATGSGGGAWIVISALSFLTIASVHVAVHLLHAQPGRWADAAAGSWSVLGDATFIPRLLHFVLAGIAFSAVVVAWWAVRQARRGEESELNTAIAGSAWRWATWATALAVVDGFVLLLLLPRPVMIGLMSSGAATMVPFTVAILLGIGLVVMLFKVSDPVVAHGTVTGTLAALALTVAVMAVTRHQVRMLYLEPFTSQFQAHFSPQWLNFSLFAVLLVLGLATVYYMVRRVLTSPATPPEAA
jgi:hypothetical protein